MDWEKDYYNILNVEADASEKEIRAAYRKLVKELHPDWHPEDSDREARMKEINEAYDVLENSEKRTTYDRGRLKRGRSDGLSRAYSYRQETEVHGCMRWMAAMHNNPKAMHRMAYWSFRRGQYRFAVSLLEKAIEISPEDSQLYRDLASCLYEEGDYIRCVQLLEKALELHPYDQDSWFNLAYVKGLSGDLKGVRRTLKNAMAFFPELPELHQKMREINRKIANS